MFNCFIKIKYTLIIRVNNKKDGKLSIINNKTVFYKTPSR